MLFFNCLFLHLCWSIWSIDLIKVKKNKDLLNHTVLLTLCWANDLLVIALVVSRTCGSVRRRVALCFISKYQRGMKSMILYVMKWHRSIFFLWKKKWNQSLLITKKKTIGKLKKDYRRLRSSSNVDSSNFGSAILIIKAWASRNARLVPNESYKNKRLNIKRRKIYFYVLF